MDLFRFTSAPNQPLRGGRFLNLGLEDSVTWTEKYRDAGEFKIVTTIDSGLKDQLPVGTLVSHVDTKEVMRVDRHLISDSGEGLSKLEIVGSSFEKRVLMHRVVGSNRSFPTSSVPADYQIPAWSTQTQAHSLITHHINYDPGESWLVDPDDEVPYVRSSTSLVATLTVEDRAIKPGSLYDRVLEILAVDNLGIRSTRPGVNQDDTLLVIHQGVDRSSTVILSDEKGDILSAEYLISDEMEKNCVLITGKWVQTRILGTKTKSARRWLHIDGTSIDQDQETNPTGTARTWIISAMQARGREALARHNNVSITSVEVDHEQLSVTFRKDYDLGDIVLVAGGYNGTAKKRVTEFVEIDEPSGSTRYPTLSAVEGEEAP